MQTSEGISGAKMVNIAGPSCSESHVPGYINSAKLKEYGPVFVVAVNDAFVYVSLFRWKMKSQHCFFKLQDAQFHRFCPHLYPQL